MQRAASGIASLTLRRLAAAAARPAAHLAVGPAPRLASEAPSAAVARFLFQPAGATPAALYARRGYAAAGRKAKAVSESEDEEDDEFEAMGSDGQFESDFDDDDDEDFEDFDDDEVSGSEDDDDCKPAKKRGRR